jgi:hypothetical protein
MATDQERLDKINQILAGPEETRIGDRMLRYDFESLRKERDDLQRKLKGNRSQYRKIVFTNYNG